ncbi:hypothetical protein DFP72DRAFT_1044205 [Ephemerocybe angulata]|uniref:Uncharacterized protein n=1 Tax=Ephemerocybe angulata TaxID=980116 RepID=A0A8H6M6P1_9AGAR|nr:hypothetical protein DFP72DRAFT_1044205 [Tulosesus angulatus]
MTVPAPYLLLRALQQALSGALRVHCLGSSSTSPRTVRTSSPSTSRALPRALHQAAQLARASSGSRHLALPAFRRRWDDGGDGNGMVNGERRRWELETVDDGLETVDGDGETAMGTCTVDNGGDGDGDGDRAQWTTGGTGSARRPSRGGSHRHKEGGLDTFGITFRSCLSVQEFKQRTLLGYAAI